MPGPTETSSISVAAQDRIVSEEGSLTLLEGTVVVESVELLGPDSRHLWLSDTTLDLMEPTPSVPLDQDIPDGLYDRLGVTLRAEGRDALDAQLEHADLGQVRVQCGVVIGGSVPLTAAIEIASGGPTPKLAINLTGLTFYIAPFRDAESGVYRRGGELQDEQLRLNLQNMWMLETP